MEHPVNRALRDLISPQWPHESPDLCLLFLIAQHTTERHCPCNISAKMVTSPKIGWGCSRYSPIGYLLTSNGMSLLLSQRWMLRTGWVSYLSQTTGVEMNPSALRAVCCHVHAEQKLGVGTVSNDFVFRVWMEMVSLSILTATAGCQHMGASHLQRQGRVITLDP